MTESNEFVGKDFRKTFKAVINFNSAAGPSRLLGELGSGELLYQWFAINGRESGNETTIKIFEDNNSSKPKMEIVGRSLNDQHAFVEFFSDLAEKARVKDPHVLDDLRIESVEVTGPAKGRNIA